MIRRLLCGLALLHLGFAMSPAGAKECGPLKSVASVNLVPLPSMNWEMVPVSVNGSSELFLLDTGGGASQISPKAAQALTLDLQTGASPLIDIAGHVSTAFVKVDKFTWGGWTANNVYLRIAPNNIVDGIIAPDLLNRYDVEMDFASQKLNYFQSDHCPGKVVYWSHTGDVAQIPIVLADKKSIKVPVKLDGQSLLATIDTGSSLTSITSTTALESFGLTSASPGMKPIGNANGDRNLASYLHTFSSLTLDGVTVKNPRIEIMPDKVSGADMTGGAPYIPTGAVYPLAPKHPKAAQLLLGMDVLKQLHLYFAFREHNLYVSTAAPPSSSIAWSESNQGCDPRHGLQLKPMMATLQRPPYPKDAVPQNFQGKTVLRVSLNSDGVPTSVLTETSSGTSLLDQTAADFVKDHWRWEPPIAYCRPTLANTTVVISWAMHSADVPTGPPVQRQEEQGATGKPVADAALAERIRNNAPSHGTLSSLRRYIESLERGQPNYDDMATPLADAVRRNWPAMQASIKRWGALRSITFKSVGAEGLDHYDVLFERGHVEWLVGPLTIDGKVQSRTFHEIQGN